MQALLSRSVVSIPLSATCVVISSPVPLLFVSHVNKPTQLSFDAEARGYGLTETILHSPVRGDG